MLVNKSYNNSIFHFNIECHKLHLFRLGILPLNFKIVASLDSYYISHCDVNGWHYTAIKIILKDATISRKFFLHLMKGTKQKRNIRVLLESHFSSRQQLNFPYPSPADRAVEAFSGFPEGR